MGQSCVAALGSTDSAACHATLTAPWGACSAGPAVHSPGKHHGLGHHPRVLLIPAGQEQVLWAVVEGLELLDADLIHEVRICMRAASPPCLRLGQRTTVPLRRSHMFATPVHACMHGARLASSCAGPSSRQRSSRQLRTTDDNDRVPTQPELVQWPMRRGPLQQHGVLAPPPVLDNVSDDPTPPRARDVPIFPAPAQIVAPHGRLQARMFIP